jgi:hypothetical protein
MTGQAVVQLLRFREIPLQTSLQGGPHGQLPVHDKDVRCTAPHTLRRMTYVT